MDRKKHLKYRSLHYKEWLIGLCVFSDMYRNRFFNIYHREDKRKFFTMTDFHTLVAIKVLQDTYGYANMKSMAKVVKITELRARGRMERLVLSGLVLKEPISASRVGYVLSEQGRNFLTSEYPKRWTFEFNRLNDLNLRIPTIRVEKAIRHKKDAHGPKPEQ